jgi:hypothetical protein
MPSDPTFNSYDTGDLIVLKAVFTDRLAALIDPSTVAFRIKTPSNIVTMYTFGTDAELIKDSVGNYHIDISVMESGDWYYRFESTGTGQAAEEGQFRVKRGFF